MSVAPAPPLPPPPLHGTRAQVEEWKRCCEAQLVAERAATNAAMRLHRQIVFWCFVLVGALMLLSAVLA